MSDKNKTPFTAAEYDLKIRKVIPMYDMIYDQIFDLIKSVFQNEKIALLDTGCGSGNLGARAVKELELSELVLCDPSEGMLAVAEQKLTGRSISFTKAGSEKLNFEEQFDVVTAIQSLAGNTTLQWQLLHLVIKFAVVVKHITQLPNQGKFCIHAVLHVTVEHLELLEKTGFTCAEIFWHSYMQSGFYGIKR